MIQSMNLKLENYLKVFLEEENLTEESILIACSGGADSMALLHLMLNLKIIPKEKIICLHFNHNWSKDSDKAENLVREFCQNNQIQFQFKKADQIGQTSEALARSRRYKFFFESASSGDLPKFPKIFTAHHQDDQVETFIMRLLRGSGGLGIQGINKRKYFQEIELIRPFLNISKEELVNYCKAHQINYYEDLSNLDKKIKRNLIRLELIPLIEKVQSNYKNQICNFVSIMKAQQDFVQDSLNLLIKNSTATDLQNCYYFNSQNICLQRELLKYLLFNLKIPTSFELIESLRNIINIKQKTKINLNKVFSFQSDGENFNFIEVQENEEKINSNEEKIICKLPISPEKIKIYELTNLKIKVQKIEKPLNDLQNIFSGLNKNQVYINLSDFKNTSLIWRKRLSGDVFCPLGCKYSVKLKKYFIDKKFTDKNTWLLAINETNEILWIPTLEISERVKVKNSSTHCFQIL